MRIFALLLFIWLPLGAAAQIRDSVFADMASYEKFVTETVYGRDFGNLIQVLGGRDEYTPEQLQGVTDQFLSIYQYDFTTHEVVNVKELGGGFRQEMRVFWNDKNLGYLYYYAFLHERPDGLVVIKFNMNSNVDKILAQF